MHPIFVPLSAVSLEKALQLRRQLYQHEDLSFRQTDDVAIMEELMADSSLGILWLIEVGGHTAGYLLLTQCYSLEFNGRFGLLDEFYLEEQWRGQGIGSAALQFVGEACRALGLKAVRLEVANSNLRALELYCRNGFAVDSRRLMTKWL